MPSVLYCQYSVCDLGGSVVKSVIFIARVPRELIVCIIFEQRHWNFFIVSLYYIIYKKKNKKKTGDINI